jgi:hypothetical protein
VSTYVVLSLFLPTLGILPFIANVMKKGGLLCLCLTFESKC